MGRGAGARGGGPVTTQDVLLAVAGERARQDAKWGEQNHDDLYWLGILTEEVGEVARATIEGTANHAEIVQVAAVAVAWIECQLRRDAARAREEEAK